MPEVCPPKSAALHAAEARVVQDLAADGLAHNQCPHCGSYRFGGLPPILHERGCPSYGVIPAWSLPGAGT